MLAMETGSRSPSGRGLGSDFWRFFTGQTVSNLGSSFTFFALPLLVYKLTGSALNLGITTAMEFIPYLLFGLVIGAWTDRLDRKRVMIVVDVLRALSVATIPVMASLDALTVWWIYGVGFTNSTLNIFFDSAQFAAIPHVVGRDDLVTANGRVQASYQGAQMAGPVLAGLLVTQMPIAQVLWFDSASFILSAISLALVVASFNDVDETRARKSIRHDVVEGLRFVLRHPVLRTISAMMALFNLVSASVFTQLVLFADLRLNATESQIGILFSAASAGMALLALFAGKIRKRLPFSKAALGALTLCGVSILVLSRVTEFWIAVPLVALQAGFGILFNIQTISLRQLIVPDHLMGRIMSIAGVLAWSAIPVGAYLGGWIIEETGDVAGVYTGIGVITVLIPLVFAFSPLGHAERYIPPDRKGEDGSAPQEAVTAEVVPPLPT
jgi:MFS family permease